MKKPKTVKGWMKMLLVIADTVPSDLKGSEKLSHAENHAIGASLADLQNSLGDDLKSILDKFNLQWEG